MIGMARGGESELERAYYQGYEDAMREVHEGRYGERRDMPDMGDGYGYPRWQDNDSYGERRGVKGTGPYSHYPRRY